MYLKKTLAKYAFHKIASCFAYYLTPLCLLLAGRPGPVTVTVTTESGECLGETIVMYEDTKKNIRKYVLFDDMVAKIKQIEVDDDGEESRKSAFQRGNLTEL